MILSADTTMTLHEQILASIYAICPFVLVGFLVATASALLTYIWQRTRSVTDPAAAQEQPDHKREIAISVTSAILTAEAYVAVFFVLSHQSFADRTRDAQNLHLTFAVPLLAIIAFYFWSYLRTRISSERDFERQRRLVLITQVIAALGICTPTVFALQDETLSTLLGLNSVVYTAAFPALTAIFALLLWSLNARWLEKYHSRRMVLLMLILSSGGLVNMITDLDDNPAVKNALLYHSMVLGSLVLVAQPVFDADGDGYARYLGGGDCDDNDADVYPGAYEIPRNGVDDDCFQGDDPGHDGPTLMVPKRISKSARRVLVKRPNIIHITVDTLSAEHLGYMGYDRATSPTLDNLAENGTHFLWAFSQGPQTRLSIPSMFTGKYFSEVERTTQLWPRIKTENTTIAEYLSDAGYRTVGFPSHRFFLPQYGLDQGFDEWDLRTVERYQTDIPKHVTGHLITDAALEWLQGKEQEQQPFYMWLHLFDPHEYYQDHPEIDFGSSALDLYDEEILYTDRQIKRLFEWLRSSNLSKNTYIIIHSDHGEGFGRHGYLRHGQHLYNDQVHVPLLFFGPGIEPRQIETPVALLDLAPTITEIAGLPFIPEFRGESLVAMMLEVEPPPHAPVFIEMLKDPTHSDRRVMISWPYKLQFGITFSEYSLYDLAQDPREEKNLVFARPVLFRKLQSELRRWMSVGVRPVSPSD